MLVIVMPRFRAFQSGMTLVELVVAIIVLAIALTAVTFTLQGGISNSADTLLQVRTVALAQAYLDEILGKRYDENTPNRGVPPCRASAPIGRQCSQEPVSSSCPPSAPPSPPPPLFGPDGGETRSRFDDVDDYHCLDEGDGQVNPLQDALGNTRTGYDNFRVQVKVRYINIAMMGDEEFGLAVNNELDDQYDAKLVTVTVSHRSQTAGVDFSAYKANF